MPTVPAGGVVTLRGKPVAKYRMTVATVETTEVEPGVLAPRPANGGRPGVPANHANASTSGLTCEIPESGDKEIRIELK